MSTAAGTEASLAPPPPHALDERGLPRFGAYAGEVFGADRIRPPAGLAALARPLRLKRWVWVGVFGPRAIASFAIADVGYLGQAFACAYDREAARGAPCEIEWLAPLALGCRVGGLLTDVRASARAPFRRMAIRGEGGSARVEVALGRVEGAFRLERLDTPLAVLTDMGGGLPGATVKSAGVRVSGHLAIDGRRIALEGSFAALDWTHAYFPYSTVWSWGTAAGLDAAGRAVGLNFCRGVHEDPAGRHTENALWLDGRPAALAPVRVEVGRAPGESWRVSSADGTVALEFRPLGERRADVNLLLVASRFRQPFGTFHGRVRDRDGRAAELDGTPGVVEDHVARW